MEWLKELIDFVLHIDAHLDTMIANYGLWTYGLLFLIVFCETGLVVTPFLPGDSLLFAVGTFAARGSLDPLIGGLLLSIAAIVGDSVNYWIGQQVGPKVFHFERSRWFNRKHLERAHAFYERHGGKTIIIARFVPIIRTYAPFVAGIGRMSYPRFLTYNILGGVLWVAIFVTGGYFFGNLPFVRRNFTFVIVAIIVVSCLPAVFEFLRHRWSTTTPGAAQRRESAGQ
jgi:membrane-associated protein